LSDTRWRRTLCAAAALACAAALLGCGGESERAAESAGRVSIALNWKPEPEFGGLWEAQRGGAFARRGLDVAITGGPGAPVVQMVEAGKVTFGIAAADEVLVARERGSDVVAVFATYQTNPQGLMVHAARGAASLGEVFATPGTLAVEPGVAYVKWLGKRFDLSQQKVVPYGFSIAPFLSDPGMAQQCFVTSEPIAARRAGADPKVFLIAESGFDPYAAVVITTGARTRGEAKLVRDFVAALREGWRGYLDDPAPANAVMAGLNKEMDAETFRLAAEAQAPLVEDAFAKRHGIGAMSLERWTTLAEQLRQLALLEKPAQPAEAFVAIP
jgi:NitT/TauT family transport system substrate-binding protein